MLLGVPSGPRAFPLDKVLRQVSYRILVKDDASGVG